MEINFKDNDNILRDVFKNVKNGYVEFSNEDSTFTIGNYADDYLLGNNPTMGIYSNYESGLNDKFTAIIRHPKLLHSALKMLDKPKVTFHLNDEGICRILSFKTPKKSVNFNCTLPVEKFNNNLNRLLGLEEYCQFLISKEEYKEVINFCKISKNLDVEILNFSIKEGSVFISNESFEYQLESKVKVFNDHRIDLPHIVNIERFLELPLVDDKILIRNFKIFSNEGQPNETTRNVFVYDQDNTKTYIVG